MNDQIPNMSPVLDSRYLRPQRATELMRTAQAIRQAVYIYGDAGFGKTSLVCNFLSRRKYTYCACGEMDGQQLFMQLAHPPSSIVVVDNLHLLTSVDDQKSMRSALEQLVEQGKIWVILISRCPLPPWLKALYFRYVFVTISENELALSEEEINAYLSLWGLSPLPETRQQIQAISKGHPLFLRIACLQFSSLNLQGKDQLQIRKLEKEAIQRAQEDWCDYLDVNVYDNWPVELQEFLTDISIVDQFDLTMAQLITKKHHVEKFIAMAYGSGNFLYESTQGEQTIYSLRYAVRASFRRRLRQRCSQSHIQELYLSAGTSYELRGQIPEALAMYETCQNEEGISRLLIHNARTYVGAAHYWELRRYYLSLSDDRILTSPELMAGMCILQSILLNDEESERWYGALRKYAASQTGSVRKTAQARLLSLDIILPHKGIAQMAASIRSAGLLVSEWHTIFPEVSLTNNQPSILNGGKDFSEWSKRDKELLHSLGRALELALGSFGKGMANIALAESYFEKGHDSYEVSSLANKGRLQAESGGKKELIFVAVAILAQLSMLNNHLEDALESLDSFRRSAAETAPQLLSSIDTFRLQLLLYSGKTGDIADWLTQAPDEDREFCSLERYRYSVKVRAYLATGKKGKALSLLQRLTLYAQKRERIYLEIESAILTAIAQFRTGNSQWEQTLQRAISQAESYHFVRILSREGAALWELLRNEKFVWNDKSFQKKVLTECAHIAELYPAYLSERESGHVTLSDKALKILRLQAQGLSVAEIADVLSLSPAGVKYYNQETYRKLGVRSKAAAITEARNRRIL